MKHIFTLAVLVLCLHSPSVSQIISNFELTNTVDSKKISLNNFSSSKGVVVIFFTNSCPFDSYYLNRIKNLFEVDSKIQVLLINPSNEPGESVEEMKSYASTNKLPIYLSDKDQKAMSLFNSRKSPECFLLQPSNGKFLVVYHGAIDDNPQSQDDVSHPYLNDAISQLLEGKKIESAEVRPIGCSLKKAKTH